jgi:hypothetical protein
MCIVLYFLTVQQNAAVRGSKGHPDEQVGSIDLGRFVDSKTSATATDSTHQVSTLESTLVVYDLRTFQP